ncbi:hypothetical protein QNI16_36060 [Cytophagaceae bacterium YF14B1]|uniref:Uncharacterized protein n=1 Tax=Xanthocytophaga flava TaxID=3048013 RepID=A0AAE3QUY8_9BACT|nr:hypothetical protein [Xanthocytophaga flavus]MDJ1485952.1 hypothetical protein [Xanthocytophaga flavus]
MCETIEIPPGDRESILTILSKVIGPYINWVSNQDPERVKGKGNALLRLRESFRDLDFDPDPNKDWDELAADM